MGKDVKEIIIVGAGLIGLCTALILGKLKFNISLIDQNIIDSKAYLKKDTRTIAISYGSKLLLEKYGLWKDIHSKVQFINNIKVVNKNSKSQIFFDNKHIKAPMGYIIEHSVFKKILISNIKTFKNIEIFSKNKIKKLYKNNHYISVLTNQKKTLHGKILIAADGKNSFIKSECDFPTYSLDYNQSSLVTNLQHEKNHNNTAYEIFLSNGPLATLPMKSTKKGIYKSSLIWSENKLNINRLKRINKNYLADIIEEQTYPYLGKILRLDNIKIFPLSAHICRNFYNERTVLIGDAAHSIHPIAGQGWNLGMRDVKYIIEVLMENKSLGLDLGSYTSLKYYNDKRFADVSSMLFVTHNLNKIFSTKSKIFNKITDLGFKYINKNRNLTNNLVNYATGIYL